MYIYCKRFNYKYYTNLNYSMLMLAVGAKSIFRVNFSECWKSSEVGH